jgi:hypothetical protein
MVVYILKMGKTISIEAQKNIVFLAQQGKTKKFVAESLGHNDRTVRRYWPFKEELSSLAKKIYCRQRKIDFAVLRDFKNQVTKDQRFFSNLNDPLKGCGKNALADFAKEANKKSNYSALVQEAIDTAEQIAALFRGQQELLDLKE